MADFLFFAVNGLQWLIIGDAILSWVMPAEQFPRSFTGSITDPLYAPIRAILSPEKTAGIDLSPILVLVLLNVMESMLRRTAF
jgi:YggT family protein